MVLKPDFESQNNDDEVNPIVMNTTDSKYLFDNEDAISFNLNPNKKN